MLGLKEMETFEVGLNVLCITVLSRVCGGQRVGCGGLSKNGSHRPRCFNTWSLVGGLRLGGVVLLGESMSYVTGGWTLRFRKTAAISS